MTDMLIHVKLVVMVLFHVLVAMIRGDSTEINFTSLMLHHLTLCGPGLFCNISQFNFTTLNLTVYDNHKVCPECFCDNLCFGRGDCCPDKYFSSSEPVCYNVTSVNASSDASRDQRSSFLMIKKCPAQTDLHVKENCERDFESIEKLQFPPVTSLSSNITYANRFCAKCNAEHSVLPWNLDIYCKEFLDVNFLSSFEEVVFKGKQNHCIMQYAQNENNTTFNCYQLQKYHFGSCNMTGFWKRKDDDILHACESNYVNLGINALYKNTFCMMCNPTFYKGEPLAQCNETKIWEDNDEAIRQACVDLGLNEGTLPYKNVFCRQCNVPSKMTENFADASASIETEVLLTTTGSDIYHIYININAFLLKQFELVEKTLSDFEKESKQRKLESVRHDKRVLNVTHLIHKAFALERNGRVCESHGIPESLSTLFFQCSCEPSCFHFSDCCEDFALQYPTACLHEKYLSGEKFLDKGKDFLVTNGCYTRGRYPLYLEKFCHQGRNDILSSHPVRDLGTDLSYSNMYCFLCNKSPSAWRFKSGRPWDIEFYCSTYIETKNFVMMERLIKTIVDSKCNVTYHPFPRRTKNPRIAYCNQQKVKHEGQCNSTGKWPVLDPEVKYACENLSRGALPLFVRFFSSGCELPYKNKFCAICNPEVSKNNTIHQCNITGGVKVLDERDFLGCSFFPDINFHWPYKNVFCKKCNDALTGSKCLSPRHYGHDKFFLKSFIWSPIYRNLFLLTLHDDVPRFTAARRNSSEEIFIAKEKRYRQLTCYPGKYLSNGTCRALFHMTKNLGYLLTADFQGNLTSLITARDLLYSIANSSRNYILSQLQVNSDAVENILVQINQPCNKKVRPSLQFSGQIAVKIFIKQTVERVQFENRLIATTSRMISTTDIPQLFLVFRKNYYDFTQYNIYMAGHFSRCTIPVYFERNQIPERHQFRTARISKILTCVQVRIEPNEYSFYGMRGDLKVLQTEAVYKKGSFDIRPDESVGICVEDISSAADDSSSSNIENHSLLSDITLYLNIISILCLVTTLLIFIFFQNLRTLPGKMTMVLILSLALALTVFHLSRLGWYQKDFCAVFGIVLHYFLLQSFTSMTTCSFHMHRIFRSTQLLSNSDSQSILKKYLVFITLLPFCIVSLNVLIMWTIGRDGSVGYGTTQCFLDNTISRLTSFVLPVGVMCLSNLIFFVGTLISIRNVPKVPGTKFVRNEFVIYCRLFTITGVTWILQIIDGFLPFSTYSYISSIINSLQGVAIFVAFILNKRVINLLWKSCKCRSRQNKLNNTPAIRDSDVERVTDVTKL